MSRSGLSVVGRERELARIDDFLCGTQRSASSLVLQGVAGIGKTVLWKAALSDARDREIAVRECRCAESDMMLSFAALGDLLEGVPADVLDALPRVQRDALAGALLLGVTETSSTSQRVVGVAVLSVLRVLAAEPMVLAIDDVQWLDAASRQALTFALRRLRGEPVHLVTSYRSMTEDSAGAGADLGLHGSKVNIGPLTVGAMGRLLRSRLEWPVSRSILTRLHDATGGNPMAALEMGLALQRLGREPSADEPLPVPADLRTLVAQRLGGLTPQTRELLMFCAALAHPSVGLLVRLADPHATNRALEEAIAAGVIECDGDRVRFIHPLLSSVPYAALTAASRRHIHEQLSVAVTDPEGRARHAALATDEPHEDIALALELAAHRAATRGSPEAAADLAALSVARSPAEPASNLQRRHFELAELLFHLGDPVRARAAAAAGLAVTPAGATRVRGLLQLARMSYWTEGDNGPGLWCDQAMDEAGLDPLLVARCHVTRADIAAQGVAESLADAQAAVQLLDAMDDPPAEVLATALKLIAYHEMRLGHGLSQSTLERALTLAAESRPGPVMDRAGMYLGMLLRFACRFDESRQHLRSMLDSARDEGDDSSMPNILGHLALLDCWAGNYRAAIASAVAGREMIADTGIGSPSVTSAHSLAEAHLGHLESARNMATADLAADEALGEMAGVACQRRSLGFIELSAGNFEAAASHLLGTIAIGDAIGVREPAILRVHGDAVDALLGLGRVKEAAGLVDDLDRATASGLPWAAAIGARARGQVLAAQGDAAGAIVQLERAVELHERVPMPFEIARTLLLLGTVLHRVRRNRDARTVLESAKQLFVRLDAPVFAERVTGELARIGGRVSEHLELTAAETRVATLAGAGRTNREVAGELVISVRTVESHLAHIYSKLQVRSRTELATRLTVMSSTGMRSDS